MELHRSIVEQLATARMELPFDDQQDFVDAQRGFIGPLTQPLVKATDGRVVWDANAWGDVDHDAPATVHPSLWRQAQLTLITGFFEVVPGIYQVRGLDISNMTFVEGTKGVIVIDPLVSSECAAAALDLYKHHRGDRPVTAMIYTHSHIDHFGGAAGILPMGNVDNIPIVAPEDFLEHAVNENLHAGPAMARRALYMYGNTLPRGPEGQMTTGLGAISSSGSVSLIPPNVEIKTTGETLELDGVRLVFQMTPGTEAPAEMNFYFPDFRALCMAENATHNMHNVVTLRGALVRSARDWARFLDESIELFADISDVSFASHHWPTWGRDNIVDYLAKQRDLYAFMHDQTLRLLNKGFVGSEIAEQLELPPTLANSWHCRGYYGSLSHNVKAVYQRYMGWFDGNPAHLWSHTPENAATRYVEYMGGADAVLQKARISFAEGDFRWVAEVVNHVVFADPTNTEARELLAETYTQLGFAAENATWRNFFLTGAKELRGSGPPPGRGLGAGLLAHLSTEQVLDVAAIRLDGMAVGDFSCRIQLIDNADDSHWLVRCENAVLSYVRDRRIDDADVVIRTPRLLLLMFFAGLLPLDALLQDENVHAEGPIDVLARLGELMDEPDPNFAIVLP